MMRRKQVLDYTTHGDLPAGAEVARELRAVLRLFSHYFTIDETVALLGEAAEARENTQPIARTAVDDHRLIRYATEAPVYVIFDPDHDRPPPRDSDGYSLERAFRLFTLRVALDAPEGWRAIKRQHGKFTRLLHKVSPDEFETCFAPLVPIIRRGDWGRLSERLSSAIIMAATSSTRTRLEEFRHAFGRFNGMLGVVAKSTGRVIRPSQPDITFPPATEDEERPPERVGYVYIAPTDEPGDVRDDTPGDVGAVPEPTETLHPRTLRELNRHGHRLRLRNRLSLESPDALHTAEARAVMMRLESDDGQAGAGFRAARLIWRLVAVTGRRFDDLLRAMLGASFPEIAAPYGLRVGRDDHGWYLRVPIPNVENFSKAVPPGAAPVHPDVTLRLPHTLSGALNDLTRLPDEWTDTPAKFVVSDILAARERIKRDIRDAVCPRFTETRLRGAIAQAIFAPSFDTPLLQLLVGDPFDTSQHGLNYLFFEEAELRDIHARILDTLYGIPPPDADAPRSERRVGAPLAGAAWDTRRRLAAKLVPPKPVPYSDKTAIEFWCGRHDALCDHVGLLLIAATGHRNTDDLTTISLHDFSPTGRFVLYRDKPSDPGQFRRIAAVPTPVFDAIAGYLAHLEKLRHRLLAPNVEAGAVEIADRITATLNGEAPLFFRLIREADEATAVFRDTPWNGRRAWREVFGTELPPNCFRHILAVGLRRRGTSGLLVEAQLGHLHGHDLFGEAGAFSAAEFGAALDTPLTAHLVECGFAPPSPTPFPMSPPRLSPDLAERATIERRTDRERFRAFLKAPLAATREGAPETLVTTVLGAELAAYHPTRPPEGVRLEADDVRALQAAIIALTGATPASLNRCLRALRRRLLLHRDRHGWRVVAPLPSSWIIPEIPVLDRSYLMAFERLEALRRSLTSLKRADVGDPLAFAIVGLITSGAVPNADTLDTLMENLDRVRSLPTTPPISALEMGELGQTRCFTGEAAVLVAGLRNHGRRASFSRKEWRQRARSFLRRLEAGDRHHDPLPLLFDTLRRARVCEVPGLLLRVENGSLPNRQLSMRDLFRLLTDPAPTPDPAHWRGAAPPPPFNRRSPHRPDGVDERRSVRTLLKTLDDPAEGHRVFGLPGRPPTGNNRKSVEAIIDRICTEADLPPLARLLAHWTRELLRPGANRKHGGSLRLSSIRTYLSRVAEPLLRVLGDTDFDAHGEDELHDALLAQLSGHSLTRDQQAGSLNRLFADLRATFDLPPLALPTTESDPAAAIQAKIVTPKEVALIRCAIGHWRGDPAISLEIGRGLAELDAHIDLLHRTGLRRAEALFLEHGDLRRLAEYTLLHVHPTRRRGLKSDAARRTLVLPPHQLPIADHDERGPPPGNRPLWPHLSGERSHAFLGLQSACLKWATGDTDTRAHHFRHTRFSSTLLDAFQADHSLDIRLGRLCAASAALGHAALSTSVGYYGHTTQLATAFRYTRPLPLNRDRQLAAVLGLTHDNVRQMRSRHDGELPLNALHRVAGIEPFAPTDDAPIVLPTLERFDAPGRLTIADARSLLVAAMIGTFDREAARVFRSSWETAEFLTAILSLSDLLDWYPLPRRLLRRDIEALAGIDTTVVGPDDPGPPSRRRDFDYNLLKRWVAMPPPSDDHAFHSAVVTLRHIALGAEWRRPGPDLHIKLRADRFAALEAAIEATGIPAAVTLDPASSGAGGDEFRKATVSLLWNASDRIRRNTLRLLIFSTLLTHTVTSEA